MTPRSITPLLVSAALLAACGRGGAEARDDSASSSTIEVASGLPQEEADGAAAPDSTEFEAQSMPAPPPTTVVMSAAAGPTLPADAEPTSTGSRPPTTEREPFAVDWQRPSGSFELAPDDVIALTDGGALVLFSAIGSATPTSTILVADVGTTLGAGRIEAVGGVIDGALVIGSCCGEGAGLWSLGAPGQRLRWFASGRLPVYDVERNWLVALGLDGDELLVHDVPSELVTSPSFAAGERARDVRAVVWASDDESWLVTVGDGAGAGELVRVEARPPFVELETADLDDVFPAADSAPVVAGLGPTGDVGLWAVEGDEVVLRFLDAITLKERPDRERTLPATATSVRIGPDGGTLVWVDGGSLRYLPLFAGEQTLGDGFVAAWFVG